MHRRLLVVVLSVLAALAAQALAQSQEESLELLSPTDVPEALERPLADPAKTPDEIADGVLDTEKLTGQDDMEMPRILPNLAIQEPEVTDLFTNDSLEPPGYWDTAETARSYGEIPPPQGVTPQVSNPPIVPIPTRKPLFVPPSD